MNNTLLQIQNGIIGTVLSDPSRATYLVEHTTVEAFDGVLRDIRQTIENLYRQRRDITMSAIMSNLGITQEQIMPIVLAIPDEPLETQVAQFRKINFLSITEKLLKRVEEAVGKDEDPEMAFYGFVSRLAVDRSNIGSKRSSTLMDKIREGVERTEHNKKIGLPILGLPTKWKKFNNMTEGFVPGLHFIGGRPSMGKTTISAEILRDQALRGNKVGFISLEMRTLRIADKIASEVIGVDDISLAKGLMTPDQINRYNELAGTNWTELIYMEEFPGSKLDQVITALYKLTARGCKLVVIDHIHRMRTKRTFDKEQMFTEISGFLSELGEALGVAVVVLGQVSRRVDDRDDKRPILSDIKYAASIEENCETVSMLMRPGFYGIETNDMGEAYPDGYMEIVVRKSRSTGKTGIIKLLKTNKGIDEYAENIALHEFSESDVDVPF